MNTCPSCQASWVSKLSSPVLFACLNCNFVLFENVQTISKSQQILPSKVPQDWSFIRIGTEFQYADQDFSIVGRIRLQLRNDYKNFWCAALSSGKHVWLMESFGSFAILSGEWQEFNQSVGKLCAGLSVSLKKDIKLRGEYVEKCEGLSFEGEIGEWKYFESGFFFIQASNNAKNTAVFTIDFRHNIFYLSGGKIEVEKLNLKNSLTWDEWK